MVKDAILFSKLELENKIAKTFQFSKRASEHLISGNELKKGLKTLIHVPFNLTSTLKSYPKSKIVKKNLIIFAKIPENLENQ